VDYRPLGRTGVKVSELCLGTMQFGWTADEPTSYAVMSAAFEAGINFFDTADIYSNWAPGNPGGVAETYLGNWMKQRGSARDRLVIATKVRGRMGPGPNDEGLSRRHIVDAAEASLRRLQTDYIDLYQTHWPDEATPIEETLSALTDLVRQGKVRYLGCSNYPAWRLMEALWTSDARHLARFDSLQPHYSLVHREEFERELAAVCRAYGLGVIPYSPLGGGFLTGKYRRGQQPAGEGYSDRSRGAGRYFNEQNWALLDRLGELGREHGKSMSAVALAWLLADPAITSPIIGPRTVAQLEENLQAVGFRLSPEERANLMA
jgi:aryl-alcohol dehydrogenase-like predicted oxidoreductase